MAADVMKIFQGLLGKEKADEVQAALSEAQKTLDGAGIRRKQGEGETGDGGSQASDEAVLTALEAAGADGPAQMVKNILDALQGEALTALEEKLGGHEQVVALFLKAIAGPAPSTEEPAPPGESPMAEGEMMKSLKDYIASTTKDVGAIARGQLDIAKAIKDMASDNKALRDRIEKLEKQLDGRPRQASRATETVAEVDDKVRKALEDGLGETTTVAGIRVKKTA